MKKSMLRSVAILATLAVSAITAATAEARWVSVGVNGLAVSDTSRACTDGIHIEGATQGGGIGFTGRWVPSGGTVDDLASPIAIERGFTPPLVPFDFPAVDPPVAIDANNDGSIDPGSELFPFYGIIDTRWDGGLQLPVGAHVRLTAPFSDVFRALVFDGSLFSNPAPNTVILNVGGLRIVLNEQTLLGDGLTSSGIETNAIHVGFNNFVAGTGLVNGNIILGHTSALATLGQPGAVPEPATWAMMLIGFGAVGFSMRRRSRMQTMQTA